MNNDSANAAAAAASLLGGMLFVILVIGGLVTALFVWTFWRIFEKAGYNGTMGLLCLIPSFGPILCLVILAFGTWPRDASGAGMIGAPAPATPPLGGPPMMT